MYVTQKEKKFLPLIIAASILIPVVVAILFYGPKLEVKGVDFRVLADLNAVLNGVTAFLLIFALVAIKNKIIYLHRRAMTMAMIFSVAFLLSYILYHVTTEPVHFGGEGVMRTVYFTLLISHIVLAVASVPLVLITYIRALAQRFDRHKKIARITFPIWLYVSITGLVVYYMILPYSE